jgi:RND family efflux transporter MFP subunit
MRAEVSGSVLQTYVEQGQAVRAGAVLARLDDTAIRDQYLSARSAVTAAQEAATIARRNLERSERLGSAGALAERDVETARVQATSAAAQLSDARSRLALAQKQLDKTQIRAPFSGVVSAKRVNSGDVVQPGGELFTVVDPGSMRLEAAVPAEQLGALRLGAPVFFEVAGYPGRTFEGKITRINPAADPATRQVPVLVSIPNAGGRLVAGLYAEGRVAAVASQGLVVPASAVEEANAANATVLRVREGRVERVPVQLGLRDERSETLQLVSGVAAGDTLLVGAAQGITVGTPVRVQRVESAPAPAAAAPSAR